MFCEVEQPSSHSHIHHIHPLLSVEYHALPTQPFTAQADPSTSKTMLNGLRERRQDRRDDRRDRRQDRQDRRHDYISSLNTLATPNPGHTSYPANTNQMAGPQMGQQYPQQSPQQYSQQHPQQYPQQHYQSSRQQGPTGLVRGLVQQASNKVAQSQQTPQAGVVGSMSNEGPVGPIGNGQISGAGMEESEIQRRDVEEARARGLRAWQPGSGCLLLLLLTRMLQRRRGGGGRKMQGGVHSERI